MTCRLEGSRRPLTPKGRRIPRTARKAVREPDTSLVADICGVVASQRRAFIIHPDKWDSEKWDTALADVLGRHMIPLAERTALKVDAGTDVDKLGPYVNAMVANAAKAWNAETHRQAQQALTAAPEKGFRKAQKAAGDVFDKAAGERAPTLARSLTTDVTGFSKVDTATRGGKPTKTWVTGPNPREEHAAHDGETVDVGEPFSDGSMWPNGPNCNCDVGFDGEDDQLVDPLTASDFDIPDESMTRTREVSAAQYQKIAVQGRDMLNQWKADKASPAALTGGLDVVRERAWNAVQEEWGGITVDAHTGVDVEQGQARFAITFKNAGQDSVSIPIGADRATFDAAVAKAIDKFGSSPDTQLWIQKAHLGVFRDEEAGRIDIDPVLVVDTLKQVEAVGAYSRSRGGAYSFKDGLGYWPPHVKETK